MKKAVLFLMLVVALCIVAGCGKKQASSGSGKTELEVAIFKVAYGQDFFDTAAREYEKTHPNVTIKVWGNPRVWEQLQPRFADGTPPDLVWPGWGLNSWTLATEGKLVDLNAYLDQKAYGQDKKWKDTFVPAFLEQGSYEGKHYIMPHVSNFYGWWYNVDMFRQHGWQPPKTYEDLLMLCERIKRAGIAPLTCQGKYPGYMMVGYFYPWVQSVGGMQAYKDMQNLKPGAWKGPACLKAAQMIAGLRDRGYFQKGCMGMDHTGAQMEFVLGRAAMVTCGTWLGPEMKDQMTPDFHMAVFYPPVLKSGKSDAKSICTQREFWIIPKDGKHPEIAADFFKYLTSLDLAKRWVEQKHTLTAIIGSDEVKLDPGLVGPSQVLREATTMWHAEHELWYPSLRDEAGAALGSLLSGEIGPQECVDRMERAASKVREDTKIAKHVVK